MVRGTLLAVGLFTKGVDLNEFSWCAVILALEVEDGFWQTRSFFVFSATRLPVEERDPLAC